MNSRVFINKLEKVLEYKYPHIKFDFYLSRRKRYVHMGLDKALFSYPEHVNILRDIEEFWSQNENREFELVKPHILVKTVRWKFDYIIFKKNYCSV